MDKQIRKLLCGFSIEEQNKYIKELTGCDEVKIEPLDALITIFTEIGYMKFVNDLEKTSETQILVSDFLKSKSKIIFDKLKNTFPYKSSEQVALFIGVNTLFSSFIEMRYIENERICMIIK